MSDEQRVGNHELEIERARKAWASLRARFALRGYQLDRLTAGAGYRIARGTWSVDVASLRDVETFAERAGVV